MRNGEGARLSIFAGLAQSAEQPSRKRQARCSSHRTSTICPASIEAMQPPCKRRSRFRFPAGAPCSLSSFGRAPGWYLGGGWIEATREHHFAPIAQLGRGPSLRTMFVGVRISLGAPLPVYANRQSGLPQKQVVGDSISPTGTTPQQLVGRACGTRFTPA
jgi:hypothetical protein